MDIYEMRALELENERTRRYVDKSFQEDDTNFWDDLETNVINQIARYRRISKTYNQSKK